MPQQTSQLHLHGRAVVITRPVGAAAAVERRVRAAHGVPVRVPGLALQPIHDAVTRRALSTAVEARWLIFASPAAVRFAHALQPLPPGLPAIGVGAGTARALHRAGVHAPRSPARQDSEGVLALPELADVRGVRMALVGAPGGRGVLREALLARGAELLEVQVYRRVPPRLDRRHVDAVRQLSPQACVLWSSVEAMTQLQQLLPDDAWRQLCACTAVVSSERLRAAAAAAGFTRLVLARSALPADLVAAAGANGPFFT